MPFTKQNFLAHLALHCVRLPKNSPFDFAEIIWKSDSVGMVSYFYNVPYPDDDSKDQKEAWELWESTVEKIQQDVINYLGQLT